jgi:Tfp pilus assembly protein FimT
MITTGIFGISIAVAAPLMTELLNRNRVDSVKNQLFTALYFARSTAITEQIDTHVCALEKNSVGQYECGSYSKFNASWSNGLLVFIDKNDNRNFDGDEELVKVFENESEVKIVMNQRGRLRFRPNGMARSTGFYICGSNDENHYHVYLLHTGRARTSSQLDATQRQKCQSA